MALFACLATLLYKYISYILKCMSLLKAKILKYTKYSRKKTTEQGCYRVIKAITFKGISNMIQISRCKLILIDC